jgi:hypothetical protein
MFTTPKAFGDKLPIRHCRRSAARRSKPCQFLGHVDAVINWPDLGQR